MGGEKTGDSGQPEYVQGSPPRGRGKGWNPCWMGLLNRITPAWAGKSYVFGPLQPGSWDHPRVGGEKIVLAL